MSATTNETTETTREPNDRAMLIRLPSSLKDALERDAARYGARTGKPVPTAEFVRLVLSAHVTQTQCPCNELCAGG